MRVKLNVRETWALLDIGCRRTLVQKVRDPGTPEILTVKCIPGNLWVYKMKAVTLALEGKEFMFWVGVIPQLDCLVLLGHYCPLLPFLVERAHKSQPTEGLAAQANTIKIPSRERELAHLTMASTTLAHALKATTAGLRRKDSGPSFAVERGLLYCWMGCTSQLVGLKALRTHLMHLGHGSPCWQGNRQRRTP